MMRKKIRYRCNLQEEQQRTLLILRRKVLRGNDDEKQDEVKPIHCFRSTPKPSSVLAIQSRQKKKRWCLFSIGGGKKEKPSLQREKGEDTSAQVGGGQRFLRAHHLARKFKEAFTSVVRGRGKAGASGE